MSRCYDELVHFDEQVPLAPLTSLGVGGPAAHFVEVRDVAALTQALGWARERDVPVRLLGGGSNLVVSDGGVAGLVVSVALRGRTIRQLDGKVEVTAGAGEPWDELVAYTVERGWAGLECLSGIPGRVGASPIQNIGAYGREIGDLVSTVHVLDRRSLETRALTARDCAFAYRDSVFKNDLKDRYVVLDVTYRLTPDGTPTLDYADLKRTFAERGMGAPTLAQARAGVLDVRRTKSMLADPADPNGRSCGSFFVNPIVPRAQLVDIESRAGGSVPHYELPDDRIKVPAAWLIQNAGFARGTTDGPVGLSTRHTLAIVAHDGARSADVVRFARRLRDAVEARFGLRLIPEPVMWGFARLDDGLPVL